MAHFIFLPRRSAARHQYWSYSKHNETFVFLECLANRAASGKNEETHYWPVAGLLGEVLVEIVSC